MKKTLQAEDVQESARGLHRLVAVCAIGISAILAAGCGQDSPPSAQEVNRSTEYFELDGVRAANGEPVRCRLYSDDGAYRSWFGFACDFEGTATFQEER